ncbi:MAG TPA: putative cytokinetic ring protein SteA [Streptosporangiaceae bacterium]|nr:putative cytokinetic ring protein SteA [Streptosporangiaceae bacterium]
MRRKGSEDLPGVTATARLDRRTKNLANRAGPGDIAIIDHVDLDLTGADALAGRHVAAVVNAAQSISGRYPNRGPQLLIEAGIPLIDDVGPEVFDRVKEGQTVRLEGDTLYAGDQVVAKGRQQDAASVAAAMAEAKTNVAAEIEAFATNTLDYIKHEYPLLIDGIATPDLRMRLEGRDVLVVLRGYHHREDIAALRSYIRDRKPAMIGVDGGADALLEAGYRPDLIVGDMDSVTDQALECGAEIVVHAYPDGRAPGLARVQALGLDAVVCPAAGTSEDVALLIADEKGASLIVAVGMHHTAVEFLDKGRSGMASTFLTRLRVDDKIVDAKGVSRLYQSRISSKAIIPLVLAAAVTILVAMLVLPAGQVFFRYLGTQLETFWYWLTGLF